MNINRICPIDRAFSINIILSIDRIFLTISNSEKKKIRKTNNLAVYCLDPQWPSFFLFISIRNKNLIEKVIIIGENTKSAHICKKMKIFIYENSETTFIGPTSPKN